MTRLLTCSVVGLTCFVLSSGDGHAAAATIQAASCAQIDVQTAVAAASNGDTVALPACPNGAAWTSMLDVTRGITIQGQGIDITVLLDAVPKGDGNCANSNALIGFDVPAPLRWRLTGLTIRGKVADANVCAPGHIRIGSTSKEWRIDHVRLENQQTAGIRVDGNTAGVIDHSEFQASHKVGVVAGHPEWGGQMFGDGSWAEPSQWGTARAVFIEDSTFADDAPLGAGAIDIMDGGRVVFRHNTTSGFLVTHGTESGGRRRGARTYEIYDNVFTGTRDNFFAAIFLRGGTGVIYNNTFTGDYLNPIMVTNMRDDTAFDPWGKCDGTSPFDQNVPGQGGYACLDQIGRGAGQLITGFSPTPKAWPNQVLEPLYQWGNTLNGVPGTRIAIGLEAVSILADRDYLDNMAKPEYAAFTYPHPLTRTTLPPVAPSNLKLQ